MASKCLVIGSMPKEMIELFDYCPIIEVDFNNVGNQILDVLNNYEDYFPLIEKNYLEVCRFHKWENSLDDIFNIISKDLENQI